MNKNWCNRSPVMPMFDALSKMIARLLLLLILARVAVKSTVACVYHDYCVVGAGPGGLQIGYFLLSAGRDYVVFERANKSGMKCVFLRYEICLPMSFSSFSHCCRFLFLHGPLLHFLLRHRHHHFRPLICSKARSSWIWLQCYIRRDVVIKKNITEIRSYIKTWSFANYVLLFSQPWNYTMSFGQLCFLSWHNLCCL